MKRAVAIAVLLGPLTGAGPASAHGGIPRAYDVVVEPGHPDHLLLPSLVWGAFSSSRDGQASWTCAELYGGNSLATQRNPMVLVPGGDSLVAGFFGGLVRVRADGCEHTTVAALDGLIAEDVASVTPDATHLVALAATIAGSTPSHSLVFTSTDAGRTFAALGIALPVGFVGSSVRTAPSDPARIYVAGQDIGGGGYSLYQSHDSGSTWNSSAITVAPPPRPDGAPRTWQTRIAAIDPSNPDTLILRGDSDEAGGGDVEPDSVWLTTDAGGTWSELVAGTGDLPGFAISPDGKKVAVAGPEDGLRVGVLSELARGGAGVLPVVSQLRLWGLGWTARGLLAGGDEYAATAPRFTLGISHDEGRTFEPILSLCDVKQPPCAAGSTYAASCPDLFSSTAGGFATDFQKSCTRPADGGTRPAGTGGTTSVAQPATGGSGTAPTTPPSSQEAAVDGPSTLRSAEDAGAHGGSRTSPPPAASSGCGCRLTPPGRGDLAPALAALALLWCQRRRRADATARGRSDR